MFTVNKKYFDALPHGSVELYVTKHSLERFFNFELSLDVQGGELTEQKSDIEKGILDYKDYCYIENEAPSAMKVSFVAYPQELDDGSEIGIIAYYYDKYK